MIQGRSNHTSVVDRHERRRSWKPPIFYKAPSSPTSFTFQVYVFFLTQSVKVNVVKDTHYHRTGLRQVTQRFISKYLFDFFYDGDIANSHSSHILSEARLSRQNQPPEVPTLSTVCSNEGVPQQGALQISNRDALKQCS